MKCSIRSIAVVACVSALLISQAAVAGKKGWVYCAKWEQGQKIEECTFKGKTKTGRIGSAPDGYDEAWSEKKDMSSGFECSPETFDGNPFDGTGYSGKLECYIM